MNSKQIDRMNGVLYGVAVGDALGAPLEMMRADDIQRKHGTVTEMIGGGWLDVVPGEITDDTQMTLCVARGIIANPHSPVVEVGKQFIDWYNTRPKDVGSTCATAISCAISFAENRNVPTELDWYDASFHTHQLLHGKSAGNGTLMRTAYPAIFYPNKREAMAKASSISVMTHCDPRCGMYCSEYVGMIHDLIIDPSLGIDCIAATADPDGRITASTPIPSGYVVHSYEAAIHCILTTSSFEKAIVKAVNMGGDADTIGAITGGLAGALYGFDANPDRWVNALDSDVRREIDSLNRAAKNHFDISSQT